MKYKFCIFFLAMIVLIAGQKANGQASKTYTPDDPVLYKAIVRMDSLYFGAYNTCNMKLQAAILADSIEFYHDKNGLTTDKQAFLDAIQKNICGKVTRHLVEGSIEVYPLNGYGAIEIGMHTFENNQEPPNPNPHPGKFICIWHYVNKEWRLSRVVSLH